MAQIIKNKVAFKCTLEEAYIKIVEGTSGGQFSLSLCNNAFKSALYEISSGKQILYLFIGVVNSVASG